MTHEENIDLRALDLATLRAERHQLQDEDDTVSYVRRAAQARLDLATAEIDRRAHGEPARPDDADLSGELRRVLSQHLTAAGQSTRPPRDDRDDLADSDLARELDSLCAAHGFSRLHSGTTLDDAELTALVAALQEFEQHISADRKARFERIDALGSELVRRYREGEASVDTLLDPIVE